jgi:hypothetical protein
LKIAEPTEAESLVLAGAVEALRRRSEATGCAVVLVVSPSLLSLDLMAPHVRAPILRMLPITDTLSTDLVEGIRLHNARQP